MSGLTLERSEFLVLMDAVEAVNVIGVNAAEIAPTDPAQHQALLAQGLQLLQGRGALRVIDDVNVLDVDLLSMALLVAAPEIAVMTLRDNPGLGRQMFLHYLAGEVVMEQTLPTPEQHRWALVPGRAGLVERVLDILPVADELAAGQTLCRLTGPDLVAIKSLVEQGQTTEARKKLRDLSATGKLSEQFIAAIAAPDFGGQVAVLKCEQGETVDGRNLAVVQGGGAAFLIHPDTADPQLLEVVAANAGTLRSLVTNWLAEFSSRQN
jgi:hypothetical protein